MGFLKSLLVRIGADASGVDKELKKAEKQIRNFGQSVGKVGDTLTKAVTLPIVAVGGAAIKLGLDAVETEQKFDFAFGSMAESVRNWSNEYAKARGLNAYEVRDTAASFETMAKGFGVTGTKAADMAKGMTDAAESMAEVYNVDSAAMIGNFMSAMKGRANGLKEYGIVIDDVTQKAYAYSHGIAAYGKELTNSQKLLANYGIIMQGASDEMLDFERTGKDLAETIKNRLTTALTDFGTKLVNTGAFDKLVDALMRVLDTVAQLADKFGKLPAGLQDAIIYGGLFFAALGPVLSITGKIVTTVLEIKKAWDAAAAAAKAAGTIFGTAGAAAGGTGAAAGGAGGQLLLGSGAGAAAAGGSSGGFLQTLGLAGIALWFRQNVMDPMGQDLVDSMEADRKEREARLEGKAALDALTGSAISLAAHFNSVAAELAGTISAIDFASNWDGQGQDTAPPEDRYNFEDRAKGMADYLQKQAEAAAKAAAKLAEYRSTVMSLVQAIRQATDAFANFAGAFDRVERAPVSADRLARRMQGQLQAIKDWQAAMGKLKGQVSEQLYQYLLSLGPAAVDEVVALANNSEALQAYAAAWQEKYSIAGKLGAESAAYQYKVDTMIQKQINNINVTGADPAKVADEVMKRLKKAGVY